MEIGEISFNALLPIIGFVITTCVVTLVRSLNHKNTYLHRICGVELTILAALFAIFIEVVRWIQFDNGNLTDEDMTTFNAMLAPDRLSAISIVVISAITIVAALVANSYLEKRQDIPAAEFFILLQCAVIGMFAFVMANDLLAMFVALEVFSIPLYVLTAFDRRRLRSLEGGFKYFILGAVSSAIFLYGIALHYGVSGSTALGPSTQEGTIAAVASVLILVGLLFKVAAVPFHFWSPDAYQGAPTPVTLFMAAATKLSAFIVLVRLVAGGVIDVSATGGSGRAVLTIVCVASALFGATVALRQANIKRAIAYSSISHTAYILLALKAGTQESLQAVVTYVVIYAFIVAGTFAILGVVAGAEERNDSMASIKGLAKTNPYLAGSLTLLLFAQAGMPLTSGFIAKFDVFRVAFQEKFYFSGVIVLISTVIAGALYLKIVLALYADSFDHEDHEVPNGSLKTRTDFKVTTSVAVAIAICVVVTFLVGVYPSFVTAFTHVL